MKLPVRKEPVHPDGEIAGAVREDRVCGKLCRQMPNDDGQIDAATRAVLQYPMNFLPAPRRLGRCAPARSNGLVSTSRIAAAEGDAAIARSAWYTRFNSAGPG